MGRFRQGSIAKRCAICAFAIYALLLQGLLAATAPAAAFVSNGDINCAVDGSGPGAPGRDSAGHHHCLCCILGCAAACAYAGTASAVVIFLTRAASTIDFAPAAVHAARAPRKYFFAARGPPQNR